MKLQRYSKLIYQHKDCSKSNKYEGIKRKLAVHGTYRYNNGSTIPGEVAEWSNAPDSKSGIPVSGIEGSNPSFSAILKYQGQRSAQAPFRHVCGA
jgi:hypothetical protein